MLAPAGPKLSDKCESISPISWPICVRTFKFSAVCDVQLFMELYSAQKQGFGDADSLVNQYMGAATLAGLKRASEESVKLHFATVPESIFKNNAVGFLLDVLKPLVKDALGTWRAPPALCYRVARRYGPIALLQLRLLLQVRDGDTVARFV